MTAQRELWPEVAGDLDELNELARTALRFPAAGEWVRQAWQGSDDRIAGTSWHIARDVTPSTGSRITFVLRPLCGRDIYIEPCYSDLCRFRTFDIRDWSDRSDKECWHCLRKRRIIADRQPA